MTDSFFLLVIGAENSVSYSEDKKEKDQFLENKKENT